MGLYISPIQVFGPSWLNGDSGLQHNVSRGTHMKPNGITVRDMMMDEIGK
jgi:hypothetical protein